MGIGIAFATGALKGYTQSARDRVEKEAAQKEKEAEQQKFYDEQFLELAGKKDANPEALRAVAKLSSFQDVKIGNIVNNVASNVAYGSVTFPKFGGEKEFNKNMTSGDARS